MLSLLSGIEVKMPPSSIISSKGQVIVPIEVRHRLGLRVGDRVEFLSRTGAPFCGPRGRRRIHLLPILAHYRHFLLWKRSMPGFEICAMTIHG
jgi:AbrB family looped-hinge helix DNA binding protein